MRRKHFKNLPKKSDTRRKVLLLHRKNVKSCNVLSLVVVVFVSGTVRETPRMKDFSNGFVFQVSAIEVKVFTENFSAENKTSANLNRYLVQTKQRFLNYWKSETRKIHHDAFLLSFLFSFCIFCHFSTSEMCYLFLLMFRMNLFSVEKWRKIRFVCFKVKWFLCKIKIKPKLYGRVKGNPAKTTCKILISTKKKILEFSRMWTKSGGMYVISSFLRQLTEWRSETVWCLTLCVFLCHCSHSYSIAWNLHDLWAPFCVIFRALWLHSRRRTWLRL